MNFATPVVGVTNDILPLKKLERKKSNTHHQDGYASYEEGCRRGPGHEEDAQDEVHEEEISYLFHLVMEHV